MIFLVIYISLLLAAYFVVRLARRVFKTHDVASLKTVTFGDEGAVKSDGVASVISVLSIFLIWGVFTGSHYVPFHVPGPFTGTTSFTYMLRDASGATAQGRTTVVVYRVGHDVLLPHAVPSTSFAPNIVSKVASRRSVLIRPGGSVHAKVVSVDGHTAIAGEPVATANGSVTVTHSRRAFLFTPDKGMQIDPIWLPSPEAVVARFIKIARSGYRNVPLWQHVGISLLRVVLGFVAGSVVGIPLGYAMGLSGWFRGWFNPIVESMRPVPPLALIPLVIIWFGIWETGKIVLLFLAAVWIMAIAARSGVSGVKISKIHAAYSLGASKWQILWHVIVPNSMPEIFTGARVAMGVCWGTVVAAELVAAEKGVGMMIMVASKFQQTDVVVMGIILIGIIGYSIDALMHAGEKRLSPWKGRG